jgi:hypothetical protein
MSPDEASGGRLATAARECIKITTSIGRRRLIPSWCAKARQPRRVPRPARQDMDGRPTPTMAIRLATRGAPHSPSRLFLRVAPAPQRHPETHRPHDRSCADGSAIVCHVFAAAANHLDCQDDSLLRLAVGTSPERQWLILYGILERQRRAGPKVGAFPTSP